LPAILITGASRGFGRALYEIYLQRGWTLFPLLRDAETAHQLKAEAETQCHPIVADVAEDRVEALITAVLEQYCNALDLLVNNAGHIKKLRWLANTSTHDLQDLFNVHCVGALRCTRAALPYLMRAEGAAVINISSRWGSIHRAASGLGGGIYSYQIAKCAQNMLTACLDQELKPKGVRVFAVHPGRLKTTAAAPDADTESHDAARRLADWIQSLDREAPCGLHDLMGAGIIAW
jgi:NAD(P)-dependent dehydrogenase (short-subunit alcohol dehydrogenase family)